VEVTGPVVVHLHVATSETDTDFTAKLIDVYPPNADYPLGFDLNIGDSIHVRELSVPEVTVLTDLDTTIATVVPPTVIEEKPAEEAAAAPAEAEPEVIAKGKKEEGEAEGKEKEKEKK